MSFIKKDVNFGLLFILVLLAIAITLIGIYYNENYSKLKEDVDSQRANFEKVKNDLLYHQSVLNRTALDLQTKEQDETELSNKYSDLRDAKAKADSENAQLKSDLAAKNAELVQKTSDLFKANQQLTIMQSDIASLNRQITSLNSKITSLNRRLDKVCAGDKSVCS